MAICIGTMFIFSLIVGSNHHYVYSYESYPKLIWSLSLVVQNWIDAYSQDKLDSYFSFRMGKKGISRVGYSQHRKNAFTFNQPGTKGLIDGVYESFLSNLFADLLRKFSHMFDFLLMSSLLIFACLLPNCY